MTNRESRIFGPVPSRRLGFSLGVDVVPFKTCTLDCVYCQLGQTTNMTLERREYVPSAEVLDELAAILKRGGKIDWITFSGSGEPTLHSGIGKMIREIKGISDIPVAVLTNGTLLYDPSLRKELSAADLVIPSIDAGSEDVFRKVNRPHPELSFEKLVQGIEDFASVSSGRIWLEVMIVRGLNDGKAELEKIAAIAARIKPERVQLNTVVRPPAEEDVRQLSRPEMREAQRLMKRELPGIPVEVITDFEGEREIALEKDTESAIVTYLKRRPGTVADLSKALGLHRNEVIKYARFLIESGKIGERRRGGKKYFIFTG